VQFDHYLIFTRVQFDHYPRPVRREVVVGLGEFADDSLKSVTVVRIQRGGVASAKVSFTTLYARCRGFGFFSRGVGVSDFFSKFTE
jgi:hypothetical protein